MTQTVLVTGASGFIATHVIDAFLHRGYNVVGTVRSQDTASKVGNIHSRYAGQFSTLVIPDIASEGALEEAVKGVDGVS